MVNNMVFMAQVLVLAPCFLKCGLPHLLVLVASLHSSKTIHPLPPTPTPDPPLELRMQCSPGAAPNRGSVYCSVASSLCC